MSVTSIGRFEKKFLLRSRSEEKNLRLKRSRFQRCGKNGLRLVWRRIPSDGPSRSGRLPASCRCLHRKRACRRRDRSFSERRRALSFSRLHRFLCSPSAHGISESSHEEKNMVLKQHLHLRRKLDRQQRAVRGQQLLPKKALPSCPLKI